DGAAARVAWGAGGAAIPGTGCNRRVCRAASVRDPAGPRLPAAHRAGLRPPAASGAGRLNADDSLIMRTQDAPRMKPWPVFIAFVLALPVAMLLAAVAAPWVQAALAPIAIFPLHRVFSRLTMLGVILLMAWLMWRYRIADRATLGYSGPSKRFLTRMLTGLAAGIALMLIAVIPLFLLDVREWNARAPDALQGWVLLALKGLGSGLAVALIEETFFRGAMQGALRRAGAMRMALLAVPVYY